jgi:hypothetical protein
MKHFSLLVLTAIALAACAKAVGPSTSPLVSPLVTSAPSPVATSIAPPDQSGTVPTATPGRVAVFPDTIIVYQRTGGIAGTSDKWTIYPTGRIVAGDGTEWQVPAEQVAPLFKLVESPAFTSLNATYPVVNACADCYTYTVTVYGPGEPQSVTFVDGADIPVILQQVMSELNTLIAR